MNRDFIKTSIGMEELKVIVSLLNQKPFNQNLTLVGIDQLSTVEIGQLIAKIFKYLTDQQINIKQEKPDQIIYKFSQILRILDYPCDFSQSWGNSLISGDRKVIYPILYFLLTRLSEHQKRCYLAKYMVLIQIPGEYQGDPQIKKLIEEYKEQQAQFQVQHQQFQNIKKDAQNPAELKKQIQVLQQQKQQLNAKINIFKTKNTNKAQFQALLQQTSLLRREQQDEARLMDKLYQQRSALQQAEGNLMDAQQRLVDAKKSSAPNNTPEQMLQVTKVQVNKNRQLAQQRLALQLTQKRKKLQSIEKILGTPPITQNQLMTLESNMMNLRRAVSSMQQKINKQNPKDDKLTIYKQQAAMVLKKKDQSNQSLKREEDELEQLQKELTKKEEQLKLMNKGNNRRGTDYLNQVKQKKVKYNKLKQQLQQLKSQTAILKRTQTIIKQDRKIYTKEQGDIDLSNPQSKKQIGGSVQQIIQQVNSILVEIKKKKSKLQPKMDQRNKLRAQYQQTEKEWKNKKAVYQKVMAKIDNQMGSLEAAVKKLRDQVYAQDTKIQLLRFKSEILQLKIQRLNQQAEAEKGIKPKSISFKSYAQWFAKLVVWNNQIEQNSNEISDLQVKRSEIKQNHQFSLNQMTVFTDLKKLLVKKLQVGKNGDSFGMKKQKNDKTLRKNVNVLKI